MNFGGPIDLTPFGSLITGIGILYWLVALAAAGIAWWYPERRWVKLISAVVVLIAFIYPMAMHVQNKRQQDNEATAQLARATALFQEQCKSAGERITRTVDNVEGVVWMKWRDSRLNPSDQFTLDDPYGHDCEGDACVIRLLRITRGVELNPEGAKRHSGVYDFVETVDPEDGRWYRYVGAMKLSPSWKPEEVARLKRETGRDPAPNGHLVSFERKAIDKPTARYGITWDDISTRRDREHWIAGGALKVIDLQSAEVVAERIGYMIDRGQGVGRQGGFRSPWGFAENWACPEFPQIDASDPRRRRSYLETATFVQRAIKPSLRD